MWKQFKFFRKWPNTRYFTYFGAQSGPQIGPLRPIFSTYLKVLAMSIWSNTDVKPVKYFWKVMKHQNFDLFWGPKWPRNWTFGAHIVHISENSSNEHIKQYWCESRGNFLTKYSKTWILTHLEAQNGPQIWSPRAYLLHTCKCSSNELVNEVSSQSNWKFSR